MLTATGLRVVVEATNAEIVRGVDLTLARGETLALVGESGSGKTSSALALMGYSRPGTRLSDGAIFLGETDILRLPRRERRAVCGARIAYVPQNPAASLNPSLRVDRQIADLGRAHRKRGFGGVDALFGAVGLPADRDFRRRYPHQLSGGQQQRVLIAMALACAPEVVILDEPTTGLDVTTQAQVLQLIEHASATSGAAFLYVTHDLAVVANIAHRVAVMYGGYIVESGPRDETFAAPRHPYTRRLLAAIPRLEGRRHVLRGIAGAPPGPGTLPAGCVYAPRCEFRIDPCSAPQLLRRLTTAHQVRCHRAEELPPAAAPLLWASTSGDGAEAAVPLLQVEQLTAEYRHRRASHVVVKSATFQVDAGACVALVGESGSGKSTIARAVAGLHKEWRGRIAFAGVDLAGEASRRTQEQRKRVQLVFQNPDRSLNPRHPVERIISRPIQQFIECSRSEERARVNDLLVAVQLPERYARRYPGELSGGERQRVAIARALAAEPDLVICDEITSALDVSVQAALLGLLNELRQSLRLSLLFISHDLAVVRHVADSVVVIRDGEIRENRPIDELLEAPKDPYTRALLAATPSVPLRPTKAGG